MRRCVIQKTHWLEWLFKHFKDNPVLPLLPILVGAATFHTLAYWITSESSQAWAAAAVGGGIVSVTLFVLAARSFFVEVRK